MGAYVIKRLLLTIPMMIGITLITFLVIALGPSKSPEEGLNQNARQADRKSTSRRTPRMRKVFGKDYPNNSLLNQYGNWVSNAVRGNFGESLVDGLPVIDKIKAALPVTLFFNVLTIVMVYLLSIPLGIFSSTHRQSKLDKVITFVLYLLYSLPTFWVAILLIRYVGSRSTGLGWFPYNGIHPEGYEYMTTVANYLGSVKYIVLPVICMVYGSFAGLSRYTRSAMIDVVNQDYIRTARAKGVSETVVIYKHALRNALIPLVTLLGGLLPGLIGGSVIIEQIFGIPGMGRMGYKAVMDKDLTLIMTTTTFIALLTMIGILLSDLLYAVVDPRISFEGNAT